MDINAAPTATYSSLPHSSTSTPLYSIPQPLPDSITSTPGYFPPQSRASSTPAPPSHPATPHAAHSPLAASPRVKHEPGEVKHELGGKAESESEGEDEPERTERHTALPTRAQVLSYTQPTEAGPSARRKRKLDAVGYTPLEVAEIESRAAAIDYAVSLDQYDTLYASQSRFMGFEDVVDRLLPWHIWQVPEEELNLPSEEKDAVDLAESSAQVADLVNLRRRFAKARRREGEHASDLPSLIYMLRESTAQLRDELSTVHASLRIASGKHQAIVAEERKVREAAALKERLRNEEIERQKRMAYLAQVQAQQAQAAAVARPPPPAPAPAAAPILARPPVALPLAGVPGQVPGQTTATPAPVSTHPAYPPPPPLPYPGTPTPAAAAHPATPGTPGRPLAPTATATPDFSAAPTRGRPRGRPRGSGRGGMRQATTTHGRPPATAAAAGKKTTPVQITVAMTLIPAFVAAALLILPNPQNLKAPATIIRTSDDRKNVTLSIDLGTCTQPQLQTLARLLNVQAKLPANGASSGSGTSSPNGTPAAGTSTPAASVPPAPPPAAAAVNLPTAASTAPPAPAPQ